MEAVDRERAEREVVERQDDNFGAVHAVALSVLCACTAAAPWTTARFGFRGFVALYAVAAISWLVVRRGAVSVRNALVVAVVLRALLLFAEPRLSGDVYRYLWDGRVSASGVNPYRFAPDDARLAMLRPSWHGRINHAEIRTIYPPHAQLLFAAIHRLTAWRLLLIACDLATLWLLRRSRRSLLAIATFPPLLFEGVWSGHIEVAAASLLTFAVVRDAPVAGAIAAGLKITPLAALPALLHAARSRARFTLAYAVTFAVPFAAFAFAGPLMPGLHDYALRWIFNSPAYAAVFALVEPLPLGAWWTAVKDPLHLEPISGFVYRHLYPDFVTRAVLALAALVAIARVRRSAVSSVGALLLFSPTIHPWYWLVIAPLAIAEGSAWTWLALAAPFSYLLYADVAPLVVYALCYGVPLVSWVAGREATSRPDEA